MNTFEGATGTQFEIAGHGYRAVITEEGACLRVLEFDGRELVVSFAVEESMLAFRGALAAPWPNRVADGQYIFDGMSHQLRINEPSRNCALHGLVFGRLWRVAKHTKREVVLGLRLSAGHGYPFQLDLLATYAITEKGLSTRIEASNSGTRIAPYGVCPHPYLRAGDSPLDSWTLSLPANKYLQVTKDRLLPKELQDVTSSIFDFRHPRRIGTTQIDHAFTDMARHTNGIATVEVREATGSGVSMSFDRSSPWVQIHTADVLEARETRLGLAVEPMTCPPDAFNSHTDLIRLSPGATHQATWTIGAIT